MGDTNMKTSRILCLAIFVGLCSAMAMANGINDPKVIIHGVNSANGVQPNCPQQGCTPVGLNFSFSAPKSGSGVLFFTNNSGQNWTSLALIEKGVPASAVSCVQNVFMSCSVTTLKNGATEILLSGVRGGNNPHNGIPNGGSFSLQFRCVEGGCWPGGLSFHGHANMGTTPEPGTVALVVTGLGAMFSRRKLWKSRRSL